jgi:hypothetical protein
MITPVHRNALETSKKKQQDGTNLPTYEAMDTKTPVDEAMEPLQAVLHQSQLTRAILKVIFFRDDNEELRDENEELRDDNEGDENEDLSDNRSLGASVNSCDETIHEAVTNTTTSAIMALTC